MNEQLHSYTEEPGKSGISWINILLGIWVLISPFVLTFTSPSAIWNNVVAGIIVGILAIIRLSTHHQPGWSWINVLLGIWLIISPFVLAFATGAAMWNNVILGIIIGVLALSNAFAATPKTA
jgi:hypothetical protein